MSVAHISILIIYGLIFLGISFFLIKKTRKIITSPFKNIFWAFTAFFIVKSLSIFSDLSMELFISKNMFLVNKVLIITIMEAITIMSSVVSNVFLFHFGISILTHKTSVQFNYKVFPLIIFFIYMSFIFSGIIEIHSAERISRQSLGFNGAFLGSIGCLNLFKINKKHEGEKRLLIGLILGSISLLFYAITEGIIVTPVLGIKIEILRLMSAIALLISFPFFIELLKEEPHKAKIGFI